MATLSQSNGAGDRRAGASPRPKGREYSKDTLCRNVTIYGHCRYEDKGCAFSHDVTKPQSQQSQVESVKKRFNADSPTFTPGTIPNSSNSAQSKGQGLSPRAASAAPFRPKTFAPAQNGVATSNVPSSLKPYNPNAPDFMAPESTEFVPQTYNSASSGENGTNFMPPLSYEPLYSENSSMTIQNSTESDLDTRLYAPDANSVSSNIFPPQINQSLAQQPLQYHLYANLSPLTSTLQSNHKLARDSFLPEDIRQKLHRKSETLLRTFGNSQSLLPYHSLTLLPEHTKASRHFAGYESSLYKAVDSRDGRTYCLRRIYPFRVDDSTLEEKFKFIRTLWRRVRNGNVVSLHEMFTNAEVFGESSLIIVSDYHPESVTLQQLYANRYGFGTPRRLNAAVPENLLWKYLVQIANALRAIHTQGLCARLVSVDKILVTDEDRIRFNGCAVGDLLDTSNQTLLDLQRSDLSNLGNLIISLGTPLAKNKNFEQFERSYSHHLVDSVNWLLNAGNEGTIANFLVQIGVATMDCFTIAENDNDVLHGLLGRELENGRIVRLLLKLNTINERPEYANDPLWSDYGPRGKIQLFRDYVFHQVDDQGRPSLNMGHMLVCLNKLDAGLDEQIKLESRDGKSIILVSFKEMKQLIETSFQDLTRRSRS